MNYGIYGAGVPFARFVSGNIPAGLSYRSTERGIEFSGLPRTAGRYVSYWDGPYPNPALYVPYREPCVASPSGTGGRVIYDGFPISSTLIDLKDADAFDIWIRYDSSGHQCDRAIFISSIIQTITLGGGKMVNGVFVPHNIIPDENGSFGTADTTKTFIGSHNMNNAGTGAHVDTGVRSVSAGWRLEAGSQGWVGFACGGGQNEGSTQNGSGCHDGVGHVTITAITTIPPVVCPPEPPCPVYRHIVHNTTEMYCPATRFSIVMVVGSGGQQDALPAVGTLTETTSAPLTPITWGKTWRALREVPNATARRTAWTAGRYVKINYQQADSNPLPYFQTPITANNSAGNLITAMPENRLATTSDITSDDYRAGDWVVSGAFANADQTPQNTLMTLNAPVYKGGTEELDPITLKPTSTSAVIPRFDGVLAQTILNYTFKLPPCSTYRGFNGIFFHRPIEGGTFRIVAIEDGKQGLETKTRIFLRRANFETWSVECQALATSKLNELPQDNSQPINEGSTTQFDLPYIAKRNTEWHNMSNICISVPPRSEFSTIHIACHVLLPRSDSERYEYQ